MRVHLPALLECAILAAAAAPLIVAAASAATVPAPRATRSFTVDVLAAVQTLDAAQISPDGSRVLVTVRRLRPASDDVERTLWVMNASGTERRQLASDVVPDRTPPAWSPNGREVAWVAGSFSAPSLVVLDMVTGDRRTIYAGEVDAFSWSPDGARIAAIVQPREPEVERTDLLVMSEERPPPRHQLLVLDARSGASLQLAAEQDLAEEAPAWSPDGRRIVFTAGDDLFVAAIPSPDAAAGPATKLVVRPGADRSPAWSPDGKRIAFASHAGVARGSFGISLVDPDHPDATPSDDLAAALDPGFGSDAPRFLAWAPEGDALYVSRLDHMRQELVRLDLATRHVAPIASSDGVLYAFSLSADGKTLACVSSSPSDPGAVLVGATTNFAPHRLSWEQPELAGVALPPVRVVRWTSADGLALEGLLMEPPGAGSGPFPLVVLTEGSHGTFDLSFSTRISADTAAALFPFDPRIVAARGYAVFMPNVRGSWGFGERLRKLVRGDIAKGPYDDLMSGLDRLVADHVADPARLAILGTGYDGYRAAYALTRTDRFRAAVLGEPFGVDLFAFWSHPWFGAWVDQGTGGAPWEKGAAYLDLSPIAHAQAIKTPTLLFCIDHDPSIAMEQCRELHHALQTLKVPTELIVQPRPAESSFGISRTRSLLDLMRRTLAWIERWNPVTGSPAPL